jgi:hypothetical protein
VTATEDFERFRAGKRAKEAGELRVTWRRVHPDTGGGYSGIGPGGALVYAKRRGRPGLHTTVFDFGIVLDGKRVCRGSRDTLREAKLAAADLLREGTT